MKRVAKRKVNAGATPNPDGYVPGAELVLFGPAVALGKHTYDALREGRPAVPPSDPLVFAVADSWSTGSGHILTLVCSNLGAHCVYVEDIAVAEPGNVRSTTRVPRKETETMGWHTASAKTAAPPIALPYPVPSAGTLTLEVTLSPFSPDKVVKKPFGKLCISYTVLGLASGPRSKTVEFAIRPKPVRDSQ